MARARAASGQSGAATKAEHDRDDDEHLHSHSNSHLSWRDFALLSWSSIGVIFGDIATSPLYVYNSIFQELLPNGEAPEKADVLGVASLIFWTLTLIVMVKYIGVVLRADDGGQGGTFALYSLLCRNMGIKPHGARGPPTARRGRTRSGGPATGAVAAASATAAAGVPAGAATAGGGKGGQDKDSSSDSDSDSDSGEDAEGFRACLPASARPWWRVGSVRKEVFRDFFRRSRKAQIGLWGVAVIATAMLMGDGVLTPAMSVLSAVSGLNVVAPSLGQDVIIGVTILVLFLVFAIQPLGTGQVGVLFAPIIALWLLANAAINAFNLTKYGGAVFGALSPGHIPLFFARHGAASWRSLGAVMLCVTGAEALFADLGHFSRGSISVAFGVLAYPCLIVTYLGQAAHIIAHPQDTDAFWKSLPRQLLYPMLVLATLATIVASQALISGIFSIIRQAMILGAFPPARIVHTGGKNPAQATQVYIPLVNVVLFVLCCIVVGGFGSTVALGRAYGLAVMTDMMTTTCLVTLVICAVWEVSLLLVVPFFALFLALEGGYWSANIIKVPEGGWFTLAVAACVSLIMLVWWAGSRRLGERLAAITAGAHIRTLGLPPPAPLLAAPPTPLAPRTNKPSGPGAAARATAGASPFAAGGAVPKGRMLYRLTSWALPPSPSRPTRDRIEGSRSMSAPAQPGSPRVVRASSVPLARLDPRTSMSLRVRTASATRPPGSGPGLGQEALTRGLLDDSQLVNSSSGGVLPPTATAAAADMSDGAAWCGGADDGSDDGGHGGGGRQRTLVVSEDSFPAGTLALVLPADDPSGGAAAESAVPVLAEGDVEMGGGGGTSAAATAAAMLAPMVVPLAARLPGIGVYYMDEKVGGANGTLTSLPPVLVHFLRNVQAIHDVCVFLSVRQLPTPSVPRHQRLRVYTPPCAAAPNFYQVVARYGYLDVIDHGPAFMSELVDAVLRRLVAVEARAARGRLPGGFSGLGGGGGLTGMHSGPTGEVDAAAAVAVAAEGEAGDDGEKPLARFGQHNPLVMARLARSLRVDSGGIGSPRVGAAAAAAATAAAAAALPRAESAAVAEAAAAAEAGPGGPGATAAAAAHNTALAAARSQVEGAVAAFLEARLQGVVYYGSRALIRVHNTHQRGGGGGLLSRAYVLVVYGMLYKWLAALAYVDMDRWRVPHKQLVELGMAVHI